MNVSNRNISKFHVQVLDLNHQPVSTASVILFHRNSEIPLECVDAKGRYYADCPLKKGEYQLKVEKRGYVTEERQFCIKDHNQPQLVFLLKNDTPFYYRGKVKVPFKPMEDKIGLYIARSKRASLSDAKRQKKVKDPLKNELQTVAKSHGLRADKQAKSILEQGVAICEFEDKSTARKRQEICKAIHEKENAEALPIIHADDRGAALLTNEVLVMFADWVDEKAAAKIAKEHKLSVKHKMASLGNLYRLSTDAPASYDLLKTIDELAKRDDVEFAEPNLVSTAEEDGFTPSDYLYPEQWDHQIINTSDAWQFLRNINTARTLGHPDIIIGVVDSGIEASHPDFNGNVSDGSSKIYQSFDFQNMVANNDSLISGHGTSCASAAASMSNNSSSVSGVNEGVSGVAGNCRLIGVRRPSSGSDSEYAEIYLWTGGLDAQSDDPDFPAQISPGADVISSSIGTNASIGSAISGTMSAAFDKLTDEGRGGKGTLLFFSAANLSNDNDITFDRPWGMYNRCFSIAASTLDNTGLNEIQAGYSNFSSQTEFCAPSHDAYVGSLPVHNPPVNYGTFTATPQSDPEGDDAVGRPTITTTLSAAANSGATQVTVADTSGMNSGQSIMFGTPGGTNTESHAISSVNTSSNQITINGPIFNNQSNGTAVVVSSHDYRNNFGGTSHATPLCAGTAALMLSANPELTWEQVRDLMRETAVKINPGENNANGRWQDINGNPSNSALYDGNPVFSEFYGYGRIDTAAAVREAGWDIDLLTDTLVFNDVPAGDTVARAVRFNIKSLWPSTFNMTTPASPFNAMSTTQSVPGGASSLVVQEVYFWVTFEGTTAGDQITAADGYTVTVTHPKTEQEWTIPIIANVIERPTSAMTLCLDKSGSMSQPSGIGSSTRLDILRFSANIMASVLHEGNGLGIVSFDEDAYTELDFKGPVGTPLSPSNPFDPDRSAINSAISNYDNTPGGLTAIGDGIERAWDQLDSVSGYMNKAVIVFTDGKETATKNINQVTDLINGQMFAVGLGKASNIEPAALMEITNGNDGYTLLAEELDQDSIFKLSKYFLQIQAGVNNEDVIVDPSGMLQPDHVTKVPFDISEADITVDVITMCTNPKALHFVLETPNGDLIKPQDVDAMSIGQYGMGAHVAFYRLTLPVPVGTGQHEGRWHALLATSSKYAGHARSAMHHNESISTSMGMPYTLLVHTYSNLNFDVSVQQAHFEPGADIHINASLNQYGIPLANEASVVAYVKDPNGDTSTFTLSSTSSGRYSTKFTANNVGNYEILVKANGLSLRNRPFNRELVRGAAVWRGGNSPSNPNNPGGTTGNQPDNRDCLDLCHLIKCLSSDKILSKEFKQRLKSKGINLEELFRCLGKKCSKTGKLKLPIHVVKQLEQEYKTLLGLMR